MLCVWASSFIGPPCPNGVIADGFGCDIGDISVSQEADGPLRADMGLSILQRTSRRTVKGSIAIAHVAKCWVCRPNVRSNGRHVVMCTCRVWCWWPCGGGLVATVVRGGR